MSKKDRFHAAQFKPTKWDSAQDKADFANWLAQFLLDGCPKGRWSTSKYNILNGMFGFIAHYDVHGFWENRFAGPKEREETVRFMTRRGNNMVAVGSAEWTWSDVEAMISNFIEGNSLHERYLREKNEANAHEEQTQLAALKKKYPNR